MGNVVVWKPANTQIYSAHVLIDLFREAGVPDGVINLVFVTAPRPAKSSSSTASLPASTSPAPPACSTHLENRRRLAQRYRSYPRLVGETGGKDFVIAHPSANPVAVAVALLRGAFEYQGQKCSAASRAYIPRSLWPTIKARLVADLATVKMGDVEDFTNFVNAVIDEKSFDKLAKYLDGAKADSNVEIVAGGTYDKSVGYFVAPTVLRVDDPKYVTMCDELFGPVLTLYVYDDAKWAETLKLVDDTSPYALTGAVFAQDRAALLEAELPSSTPPATSISTTSLPAPWWVSSPLAAPALGYQRQSRLFAEPAALGQRPFHQGDPRAPHRLSLPVPRRRRPRSRRPRRRHLMPPTTGRNFLFLHSLTAVPHGSAVFCRKCPRLTPSASIQMTRFSYPQPRKVELFIFDGRARKAFLL